MSLINHVATRLKSGLITFINAVILANRDFPYNDFETATLTSTDVFYRVGKNNRAPDGAQSKFFISKSTLILATVNAYVRFNSAEAVRHTLIANNYYEFKSNIRSIHYAYVTTEGTIYIHCEGVLPQEARGAE